MKRSTEAIARFIERKPWWLVIVAIVLATAVIPGITMLKTETGFNALVSSATVLLPSITAGYMPRVNWGRGPRALLSYL